MFCRIVLARDNCKFLIRNYSKIQNMSKPILYGDEVSPPVRFTMITASLLGVDLDFHKIDLVKQENRAESYKKINPLQKVPALSVNGQIITDSHAIALYLCRSVDKQDLYPKDNIERAKVDQMIFFNATTLFPIDSELFVDLMGGKWPVDEAKAKKWNSALDHLERQLNQTEWLAGNKMLLCDICCAMTISSLSVICPPLERHVKVKEWLKKLDSLSVFEVNRRAVEVLRAFAEHYKAVAIAKKN